ncbi:MAG TPA: right-handed parallel beta-helix repeat-containing protein, partial [Clostridia bacterium]|nr:right-handed parallel beta-helix repeat-containing protein [Clostridia bacterium]
MLKSYSRLLTCVMLAAIIISSLIMPGCKPDIKEDGVFYVSPKGNDNNSGSKNYPFKTIKRAQEAVRAINDSMTRDITVNLFGGTYYADETLDFIEEDSGSGGYKVIWQGMEGEEAVISGGRQITGWKKGDNGIWYADVPDFKLFRELYVNDTLMSRAALPYPYNNGISWIKEYGEYIGFTMPKTKTLEQLVGEKNLEVSNHVIWRSVRLPVEEVRDLGNKLGFYIKYPLLNFAVTGQHQNFDYSEYFFIENALCLLDSPGEWFLDKENMRVYYMPLPGQDVRKCNIVAPQTEQILSVGGNSVRAKIVDVTFRNISFKYGNWTMPSEKGFIALQGSTMYERASGRMIESQVPGNVYVKNARSVTFERCSFSLMSGTALVLRRGLENCTVNGCAFYDLCEAAIVIGQSRNIRVDEQGNWDLNPNTTVSNCVITRVGKIYPNACAIQLYYTKGAQIIHNEISECPYTGISLGWGWGNNDIEGTGDNRIANNIVSRCNLTCWDGGTFYSLGKQQG